MRIFHCYRKADGTLTGSAVGGRSIESVSRNETDDLGLIEGVTDWQSQCVDLSTLTVIDYQPPQPSQDHVWRDRRWVLSDEASARIAATASALARIRELEGKQARAVREATLGQDGAADRLQAIDDEIAQLRKVING